MRSRDWPVAVGALTDSKWCGALCCRVLNLRCARTSGGLQSSCDGCNQQLSVRRALLERKKGSLVISRHNEIRDKLIDLASKTCSLFAVCDEPKIQNTGNSEVKADEENKENSRKHLFRNNPNEDCGDILIRGLWACGTDCIVEVGVTDVDAMSNRSKDPHKALAAHEREKNKKGLGARLEQRRKFSPFVVSADGLPGGKEASILLEKLSARLAQKWEKPCSEVCGFVNARVSIAIVRAAHLCLRGSRIPTSKMCNRLPQWENKAGLGLFRR